MSSAWMGINLNGHKYVTLIAGAYRRTFIVGVPGCVPVLRHDPRARRTARHRLPGTGRAHLPRLHGRERLRPVAAGSAPHDPARASPGKPAFDESELVQVGGVRGEGATC